MEWLIRLGVTARAAFRDRSELVLENAFLRQQLAILQRRVPRVRTSVPERTVLAFLASWLPTERWHTALRVATPSTLIAWHRDRWRALWRSKSRAGAGGRKREVMRTLVLRMAAENPRWGAKRIVGELGKLGIPVHKRTVQRILRAHGPRRPRDQSWMTFVRNHLSETWACDFFTVPSITARGFGRQLYVFFVMKLGTREVVHWAVTESPSRAWTTQQLREAMPWGRGPRFLVRDRDDKFGDAFDAVASASGTRVLKTPPRSPRANAFAERFVGTARRECLDHFVVPGERFLRSVFAEFIEHYNHSRPHQGIEQRVPLPRTSLGPASGAVGSRVVLDGLIREYFRLAS